MVSVELDEQKSAGDTPSRCYERRCWAAVLGGEGECQACQAHWLSSVLSGEIELEPEPELEGSDQARD